MAGQTATDRATATQAKEQERRKSRAATKGSKSVVKALPVCSSDPCLVCSS